ncbi:hypothetical protein MASR1M8_07740 [Thermomonas brevis]
MLLRATIVMLVMLNIGAGLWWLAGPVPASLPATAHATDAPTLRMLDEAMPPPVQAPSPSPVAPPAEAAADTAEPVSEPPPVVATDTAAPAAVCLRFGPFDDAAARDAARTALAGAGVQGVARESPARAARGWKVSMPAFPSRTEAVAMAERLRAAGVADLYVMGDAAGSEANSIALGRYGSEEAARRRQADLRGKGFSAQAEPLGDVPTQAWLDARIPAGTDPASLGRIAATRALDCASLR